jgi:putative DNA-invertase from lambdoid prophage Rac
MWCGNAKRHLHPGGSENDEVWRAWARARGELREMTSASLVHRQGGVTKRAALYLRVSTDEQSTDNQRPELEQLARVRGLEIVAVYEEQASAAKTRERFDAMRADAHRGAFDVLLVWALDRFGRSMVGNLGAVLELDRRGVQVVSAREAWLDTGGPTRNLLVAIFSWVAEQERAQLIARTNAGLERARRRGVRLGRPRARVDVGLAQRLASEGLSQREIAKRLDVPWSTFKDAMRRWAENPPAKEGG